MSAPNATMKLVTADGKTNTGKVATGNVLELYDKNNRKLSSYTIVVYGDTNGDGAVDVLDMIKTNRHILGLGTMSGCYEEAGNANRQNDGVNVLDLIYINRHILGDQLDPAVEGKAYEMKKLQTEKIGIVYWGM